MSIVIRGDLTNMYCKTPVIIAHQCNCRGAFGSGLAAAIRVAYPKVYEEYVLLGDSMPLMYGDLQPVTVDFNLTIVNCFSQMEQGKYYDLVAIKSCMNQLKSFVYRYPGVLLLPDNYGSGIAGGNKSEIHNAIESILPEVVWVEFVGGLVITI